MLSILPSRKPNVLSRDCNRDLAASALATGTIGQMQAAVARITTPQGRQFPAYPAKWEGLNGRIWHRAVSRNRKMSSLAAFLISHQYLWILDQVTWDFNRSWCFPLGIYVTFLSPNLSNEQSYQYYTGPVSCQTEKKVLAHCIYGAKDVGARA